MKQIKKNTRDGDTQYFEIITSREELTEILNYKWDNVINGEYTDEDTAVHWYLKDGSYGCLIAGLRVPKKPATRKIVRYIESNPATTVLYGKGLNIVQNGHYGDWEVEEG